MIKIENVEVYGWGAAIRGMRNPMNSWDKSDSDYHRGYDYNYEEYKYEYIIGDNDLALMKKLAAAGSDHRKFMRMINVTCDITSPMYWWKEFDTYKVGTVRNSCSTMHKITDKEFELDDFSHEHLDTWGTSWLKNIVYALNVCRGAYLRSRDKNDWWLIIQLLPSSYNQRATVQLNYEVLANIYRARKNHKLDEWCDFCRWIESLPYSELITGGKDEQL